MRLTHYVYVVISMTEIYFDYGRKDQIYFTNIKFT